MLALPAEHGVQLRVDEPREQRVPRPQREGGLAPALGGLRVLDRRRDRGVEDLGGHPARVLRLAGRAVVDLLQHARHRDQERRAQLAEPLDDRRGVGLVRDGDALVEAVDLEDPGQHVGERQEDQGVGARRHRDVEPLVEGGDDPAEPAVYDLAALGPAGGPRGVDEAAQVVVAGGGRALLDGGVRHVLPLGDEGVDRAVAEDEDVALPLGVGGERAAQLVVLHHGEAGARIGEDPVALVRRRGLVDRHAHRAGGPDGPGQQRPVVTGVAHDHDAVRGLDAPRHQALGHRLHLVEELGARDVLPPPVRVLAHGRALRVVLRVVEEDAREVGHRQRPGGGGRRELGGRHLCVL